MPPRTAVNANPEVVAQRAYELWESRGYEHGADLDDWFRAEAELVPAGPRKPRATAKPNRKTPSRAARTRTNGSRN